MPHRRLRPRKQFNAQSTTRFVHPRIKPLAARNAKREHNPPEIFMRGSIKNCRTLCHRNLDLLVHIFAEVGDDEVLTVRGVLAHVEG